MNTKKSFFFVSRCTFLQHCIAPVWKCYGCLDFSMLLSFAERVYCLMLMYMKTHHCHIRTDPWQRMVQFLYTYQDKTWSPHSFLEELLEASDESLRKYPEGLTAMFELSCSFNITALPFLLFFFFLLLFPCLPFPFLLQMLNKFLFSCYIFLLFFLKIEVQGLIFSMVVYNTDSHAWDPVSSLELGICFLSQKLKKLREKPNKPSIKAPSTLE